jgi:ABC-type Fe3+ transport system, permease component
VALLTAAVLVAALMAVPLVFLLIEAAGAGAGELKGLIFRSLTWSLLWNTVRLAAVVTAACAVIGTGAAWCVERTDLPGRRVWAVLVVIPLAIPDFVVSFGWNSLWTWAHGFTGASIVMTLAVYPLVYLPVAASLRVADPGQEEVARSLGVGRVRTFARITLGQARARSSAAACWSRSSCWPSSARSRSSATRRSRPRSSPNSTGTASPPPARCPWCSSCSACWCWPARARSAAAAAGSPGPAR